MDGNLKSNPRGLASSRRKKKDMGSMVVAGKEKLINFVPFCKSEPGIVTLCLPIRTFSPNQFEAWQKKYKREKAQKRAVIFAIMPYRQIIKIPCILKFTRYAPGWLDAHDNLPMSMKKIVDQVCAEITCDFVPGRADSYDCFTIQYAQEKCKNYGVKIEIIFNK
jgi:hypothetical protein